MSFYCAQCLSMTDLTTDGTKCSRCTSPAWEVVEADATSTSPTTHLNHESPTSTTTTPTCSYQPLPEDLCSKNQPCGQTPSWFCLHHLQYRCSAHTKPYQPSARLGMSVQETQLRQQQSLQHVNVRLCISCGAHSVPCSNNGDLQCTTFVWPDIMIVKPMMARDHFYKKFHIKRLDRLRLNN